MRLAFVRLLIYWSAKKGYCITKLLARVWRYSRRSIYSGPRLKRYIVCWTIFVPAFAGLLIDNVILDRALVLFVGNANNCRLISLRDDSLPSCRNKKDALQFRNHFWGPESGKLSLSWMVRFWPARHIVLNDYTINRWLVALKSHNTAHKYNFYHNNSTINTFKSFVFYGAMQVSYAVMQPV